jgi:DNA-binding MarR family transcriptional regulator
MSRGSEETRATLLAELARELRQFSGLSASYFRAAAVRSGMTATDMQVIDSLAITGPTTAGQLADLTGLTTGAITGMVNRLEEARVVRRERDPEDGRRVIVQLAPDKQNVEMDGPSFASIGNPWDELAARYDEEQLALLVQFLQRSNAISREEILRLREAPAGEGESILPRWVRWRVPGLSSPQELSDSSCARMPRRARSTRPALRARRRR